MNIPQLPVQLNAEDDLLVSSWRLGYHDGYLNLSAESGKSHLSAHVSDLDGRLAAVTALENKLKVDRQVIAQDILPSTGALRSSLSARLFQWVYFSSAIIAIGCEFFIWNYTAGQSFGGQSKELKKILSSYLGVAIAIMFSLLGISLKMWIELILQAKLRDWRNWFLVSVITVSMAICFVTAMKGAGLREKVTLNDQLMTQDSDPKTGIPYANKLDELNDSQNKVAVVQANTLRWLAVSVMVFAGVCLAMFMHENRKQAAHAWAVTRIGEVDAEIDPIRKEKALLMARNPVGTSVSGASHRGLDIEAQAHAAYHHGYETGTHQALDDIAKEPMFPRLVRKLKQEYR